MADTLLLNATYEPLCVVAQRRALVLVLLGKAAVLEAGVGMARSERTAVPLPAVVRLTRFVRVPHRAAVPLTRRAVFARDDGRCAYCSGSASSLDHVVPRSRGGQHTWENVVAACARCNHTKADRTLAELGWRLRVPPRAPAGVSWRVLGSRTLDPCWAPYLGLAEAEPALQARSA